MTAFTLPFPSYECHKRVQALRIKAVVQNPRGVELHFEDERFVPIQFPTEWFAKHQPAPGGYVVWYPGDNYVSFSPAAAFESGYTLVETADGAVGSSPDWSAWPGGPSEVEAALASRDAEIERLKKLITDKIWDRLDTDQCCGAPLEIVIEPISTGNREVGPATQAARDESAPSGWQRDLVGLRYAEHIRGLFESLFEPWMDQSDQDEMVSKVLALAGVTLKGMDEEIQVGVERGYSPEHQMEVARRFWLRLGVRK